MTELWMFVGALAVAYLVPGPDMLLLLQTAASHSRLQSAATIAGLALARAAHVALAGLGLAALLQAAPWAFNTVRLFGAGYLIWLGISIWRASSLVPENACAKRSRTALAAFRRGLLTNISNPKALLFCSVLLPQFIHPQAGSVALQFTLLGLIVLLVGVCFDLLYVSGGRLMGGMLRERPRLQQLQRWTFGALLVGFGARLMF